jgi:hypothetical protein
MNDWTEAHMHPLLNQTLADTRAWELRREAAAQRLATREARRASGSSRRRRRTRQGLPEQAAITIRPAYAADRGELRRLAELDSAERIPAEPLLVAKLDGRIRAALGGDGEAIADPFVPTSELIELLRAHARFVSEGTVRPRWFRMPRLAPVSSWRRAAA